MQTLVVSNAVSQFRGEAPSAGIAWFLAFDVARKLLRQYDRWSIVITVGEDMALISPASVSPSDEDDRLSTVVAMNMLCDDLLATNGVTLVSRL